MPTVSASFVQSETVAGLLETARAHLRNHGGASEADSVRVDTEMLLAHVLQCGRSWLFARGDERVDLPRRLRFADVVEQRASGMPLAYILGTAWFYGRAFKVTRAVLIPRPETEHLIDEAIAFLRRRDRRLDDEYQRKNAPVILDVGTGSGAIAITLAAEFPGATVYATETSSEALEVARHNARVIASVENAVSGVEASTSGHCSTANIRFEHADLLPSDPSPRFDVVLANLPYIPSADVPQPPNPTAFEPQAALDGGIDGLTQYRRLFERLPSRLSSDALVLLEAAPPTIAALRDLATTMFTNATIIVGKDYAGLDRLIAITSIQ